MKRLSVDDYFMSMAIIVSARSTCVRRAVGCVALNEHNHVMATGYNGTPRGMINCIEHPCPGSNFPSGEGLDVCQATHAELNCIIQCRNTMGIKKLYITAQPCVQCIKAIMNTGCEEIVYMDTYPGDYKLREGVVMRQHWSNLLVDLTARILSVRTKT